jgi:peptidoglycan/LPS O-acetylase OafA/YrhL
VRAKGWAGRAGAGAAIKAARTAPDALPVTPAHGHRTDVEGLRAIAIGLVLLYHGRVEAFGGGFIGVDVFFVISGFLITRSLVGELEQRGTIALGAFYARRVRRLLPAAALMLAATAAAVRALLPPTAWRDFGGDIAAAAGYAVNWRLALRSVDYLAEDVAASPVLHCWSLAIEEQFYLVWPLLLLLGAAVARGRGRPARPVLLVVLAALVLGPSLVWSAVRTASRPELAFFDTGARMWELAAGGLVALTGPGRLPSRARTLLKALAVAALVGLGLTLDDSSAWPGVAALAVVGPTALLLWLGGRGDDPVERALSLPPLQRIGAWSYSLYLWHWPPLALLSALRGPLGTVEALAIVALSFVPAVLSYHLVENPVRFAPALRGSTRLSLSLGANLSLAGLVAGFAVAAALPRGGEPLARAVETGVPGTRGGAVGAAVLSPDPLGSLGDAQVLAALATVAAITPTPTLAANDLPRAYADRCDVDARTAAPRLCRYGDPAGRIHVALVGDSKAGQWGDALETIALRRGWRLSYLLKSTCELSTSLAAAGEAPDPICREWSEAVLERLAEDPPQLVLTSQVSSTAWSEGSEAAKREALVTGMLEAYARLRARGSEVAILVDNPSPALKVHECVSQHLDDLAACAFPRDTGSGGRPAQLAAALRGGYPAIDLADYICPGSTCPPVIGNVLVYRQGSHLTRTYVATLTDVLEQRLVPLVESAAGPHETSLAQRAAAAAPPASAAGPGTR